MADKSVCLSSAIYRLLAYWTSAIGYRLSAIGYRLSAIGYRLSAIGYAFRRGAIQKAFCRKPILSSLSPAGCPSRLRQS
jgi:hypothetical protein